MASTSKEQWEPGATCIKGIVGLVPEGVTDIARITGIVELVLEGVDDVAEHGHRRT